MKTLGILGGMGPMATACFMERITAMTAADTDQEQIPVIVYSNTQIPDRSAYLLGRPQAENPVTALRQTAHFFSKGHPALSAFLICHLIGQVVLNPLSDKDKRSQKNT